LLVELAREKDIIVGKLGYIYFPKAFYAYVGSAMNGLETRLAHYLRDSEKPHWHIDYLLKQAKLQDIILCPSEPFASCHSEPFAPSVIASEAKQSHSIQGKLREESHRAQGKLRVECFLAQALAKEFQFIPNFGASDCKCKSHLYFADDKDKLTSKIIEVANQSGLTYRMFSREEMEFGRI
jgi:Uri superfamily endonuclease